METLDYTASFRGEIAPSGSMKVDGLYEPGDGVQFRSCDHRAMLTSEMARLTDDAILLLGDHLPDGAGKHRQIVPDGDWIHLQFRYSAGGFERMGAFDQVMLPRRACVISRYAKGVEIVRELSDTERWQHVCVFATEKGLSELLDISVERFQRTILGRTLSGDKTFRARTIPLKPAMISPGREVISCSLGGLSRRAFMRAKSLELLSAVLATLDDEAEPLGEFASPSAREIDKIREAQLLLENNLHGRMTLSEIARKVGMSRTAFATSFRTISGETVQEYWRNLRLNHAYGALATTDMSVTQIALDTGYSELSFRSG